MGVSVKLMMRIGTRSQLSRGCLGNWVLTPSELRLRTGEPCRVRTPPRGAPPPLPPAGNQALLLLLGLILLKGLLIVCKGAKESLFSPWVINNLSLWEMQCLTPPSLLATAIWHYRSFSCETTDIAATSLFRWLQLMAFCAISGTQPSDLWFVVAWLGSKRRSYFIARGYNCLGILWSDSIPVELEGTSIFLTLGMFLQRGGGGALFESCHKKPKVTT